MTITCAISLWASSRPRCWCRGAARRRTRPPDAGERSLRPRRRCRDRSGIVELLSISACRGTIFGTGIGPGAVPALSRPAQRADAGSCSASPAKPTRGCSRCQADHVGYRDQRYSASYNNYGKLKVVV